MARHVLCSFILLVLGAVSSTRAAIPLPKPLVSGLKNPESVVVGSDGRIYVSVIGEFDKDGDGAVMVVVDGKAVPFATGLDDPKGMVAGPEFLYVADKQRIWRIDRKGKADVFVTAAAFPRPLRFLNDLAIDEGGALYVSDSGDLEGGHGAVYRVNLRGEVEVIADGKRFPGLKIPNGLLLDGASHLLVLDFGSGELHRIKLSTNTWEKIADGFVGGDGLAWDKFGRLYISNWKEGKVFVIPRPGDKPILLAEGFQSAADLCLDASGQRLLVPDMKAGTITALPIQVPDAPVDVTPLSLEPTLAFPDLKWAGWSPEGNSGKPVPLRPIVLTHAGDGSNRVFVATQQGVIHVFPNEPKADKTEVFLDLQDRVHYNDNQNEEGLLGMAFHPQFKKNGELFVFYTPKKGKQVNLVSRFRAKKDNPSQGDPASEEVLLRIADRPYWNHDGGTIAFGPDGYLYVALGDGGAANDPFGNGQKLDTLLGKILRLDVDRKDGDLAYAIPKDNPFVAKEGARKEIYAYGLRNPWRIAFDRKTGQLWAADVGQNLFEEINLIVPGGNYGWNLREGLHPFGARGVGPRPNLIDPIWEYHHDVGKSITGGSVYRGKRLPELAGHYLYGDYVSGRLWALRYDDDKKRVVANRPLKDRSQPLVSWGEDEQGEIYFLTVTPNGKGIHQLERTK